MAIAGCNAPINHEDDDQPKNLHATNVPWKELCVDVHSHRREGAMVIAIVEFMKDTDRKLEAELRRLRSRRAQREAGAVAHVLFEQEEDVIQYKSETDQLETMSDDRALGRAIWSMMRTCEFFELKLYVAERNAERRPRSPDAESGSGEDDSGLAKRQRSGRRDDERPEEFIID